MNRTQPLMPDMVLKRAIRPALTRAGITAKIIGWHSFRRKRHFLAALSIALKGVKLDSR